MCARRRTFLFFRSSDITSICFSFSTQKERNVNFPNLRTTADQCFYFLSGEEVLLSRRPISVPRGFLFTTCFLPHKKGGRMRTIVSKKKKDEILKPERAFEEKPHVPLLLHSRTIKPTHPMGIKTKKRENQRYPPSPHLTIHSGFLVPLLSIDDYNTVLQEERSLNVWGKFLYLLAVLFFD